MARVSLGAARLLNWPCAKEKSRIGLRPHRSWPRFARRSEVLNRALTENRAPPSQANVQCALALAFPWRPVLGSTHSQRCSLVLTVFLMRSGLLSRSYCSMSYLYPVIKDNSTRSGVKHMSCITLSVCLWEPVV